MRGNAPEDPLVSEQLLSIHPFCLFGLLSFCWMWLLLVLFPLLLIYDRCLPFDELAGLALWVAGLISMFCWLVEEVFALAELRDLLNYFLAPSEESAQLRGYVGVGLVASQHVIY